ncbi:MAG TPA: SMP-30/gluconolactonase/LRE family protein [Spirochaetia bacterium]|nr:SMP-30/gluconolactonase/LRE family protein [Spirochaetia bacterium]
MESIEVVSPKFRSLTLFNAAVETLYTGTRWGEGPVWFGDAQHLLWSDIPNNRMLRWTDGPGVSVFRSPSNYSNGNTRDRQGRLVTCEHGTRRVTRTEHDGRITVVADSYAGKKLNSPNDVVVKSDDTIWFSDPPYGILNDYEGGRAESELDGSFVFCFDPRTAQLTIASGDLERPNGLAFSPDESLLYVSDTGESARHIKVFSVRENNRLTDGRVFAKVSPGVSDGFRLDEHGNIWTSARDGVHCISPQGELLGKILLPDIISNVVFGGLRKNRLFATGANSLFSIYLNCRGVQTP